MLLISYPAKDRRQDDEVDEYDSNICISVLVDGMATVRVLVSVKWAEKVVEVSRVLHFSIAQNSNLIH